jgi:hypothetical protein
MKKKKILFRLSVVISSFLLLVYICIIFTPKDVNSEGGYNYYRGTGFLSEPKNSLDVIAFGHSSVYSGFTPNTMYKEYGYTTYASGTPMQNIISINHLLKKAIKKQKPKIAMLEVDCLYYYINDVIENTSWLKSPIRFHNRWKHLKFKDFVTIPDFEKIHDSSKGFNYNNSITPVTNYKTYMGNVNDAPQSINQKNIKHLYRFIERCRKNNIKIVFFVTTNTNSWNYGKHNYISDFAVKNGIDFLDYNINPEKNIQLDFSKDFRDNGSHLNTSGAIKTTNAIGRYLKENYGEILIDKRKNSNYNYWKNSIENHKSVNNG